MLVVSQFAPRLPWSVGNAMARNGTIIGLAQAMVIVEAGLSGGTFAAGEQALRMRKPLFVVAFAQPAASAAGNAHFIQRGATPIRRSKAEGRANVEPILSAIHSAPEEPEPSDDWLYAQQPALQLQLAERGNSVEPTYQSSDESVPADKMASEKISMTKRLIEYDLPLAEISEASAHEKNVHHVYLSSLHIWWARRPLASSRATAFAALIDDPGPDNPEEREYLLDLIKRIMPWEAIKDGNSSGHRGGSPTDLRSSTAGRL